MMVRAVWEGRGPAAAFMALESKRTTLKGRKFHGVVRGRPQGGEYYACFALHEGDDPANVGLEVGEIPAGWYARRRIRGWETDTRQLGVQFEDTIHVLGENVDPSRPEIEFYRSHSEVLVFEPVKSPVVPTRPNRPRSRIANRSGFTPERSGRHGSLYGAHRPARIPVNTQGRCRTLVRHVGLRGPADRD